MRWGRIAQAGMLRMIGCTLALSNRPAWAAFLESSCPYLNTGALKADSIHSTGIELLNFFNGLRASYRGKPGAMTGVSSAAATPSSRQRGHRCKL